MRAVQLHEAGHPPVVGHWDPPQPGQGEVLVDVLAAPITPLDLLCASGSSYFGVPRTPYVPGVQGVGTVDGELVWFATSAGMAPGDGSMAEQTAVPRTATVRLPDGASPTVVAALGLSAVAAWMALRWRGELVAGEQVVVLGAGGVVGQAAVQIAHHSGARRVVAVARSLQAQSRAAQAGADAVVALDTEDVATLAARIADACDGPADLVLDPLFGAPAAAAARTLGSGGRLVNLGSSAGETCPLESATLRSKSLRVLGYTNNALTHEQRREALTAVVDLALGGHLAVDHDVVPLHEATGAWQRQSEGTRHARAVLVTDR
ncbi:quinone oxidoreductase family protein [Angustibacter luteus]|uniref:Zinc-binding alcohol dehydrogenase family protein n=1 Tax=Angustibacter luteus TaxID=658456 RepID=A0ABW1JAI9_9ACTN